MLEIMRVKGQRRDHLADHPFYDWIEGAAVPVEDKLTFAPILVNFVMNFRDINKWFLRFPTPESSLHEIINGNTLEDETHSQLFLEDWRKLRLDEKLGWRSSDMLWWLFIAEETEPLRRFGMRFSRMSVVDGGDPRVRFAHSEAGEACGHCFFFRVAPIAAALQAKTGIEYRYFGDHHLQREPGHVLESQGVFEKLVLEPEARARAIELATEMFDISVEMHDCFLRYAEKFVVTGAVPSRNGQAPVARSAASFGEPGPSTRSGDEGVAPSQRELQRLLEARKARTAEHPFYAWLQRESAVSPLHKLQRFIPMWTMDIMGYRDLNRYALRYPVPADPGQAALNRWIDDLETHSPLFLSDWDALGMDDVLGWNASETLEFLFLDPQMDVHRRNIASFIKLAFGHPEPLRRFWLLEALESSGYAFFRNTRALATRVEASAGLRLDYLADRHDTAHRVAGQTPRAAFKLEPMESEDREVAAHMINTVFDAVDEQLSISLDAAESNRFSVA